MARILIVTAWYYPFIHPRAHRWTSLAEYWAAQGHQVDVVCARRRDCPAYSVLNGVQVQRVGFDSLKELFYYWRRSAKGRGRVGAGVQRPGWGMRLLTGLYSGIWKKIYFPDDAAIWFFPARRKVLELLRKDSYDALITVSLPFTGHLIGLAAKRHFPDVHWLADIGDPFTIQAQPLNNSLFYKNLSRRLEKRVLEQADQLTVTHPAAKRAYHKYFGSVAQKIQLAPPLLHPIPPEEPSTKPNPLALPSSIKHGIRLGYFGALYAPVRTPDAFLVLLEKVFLNRPDLIGRLQAHFFGDVFPEFFQKLNKAEAVQLHGLQSRQTVRAAMQQMDFLLNIGNTTDYQLPSKVVDYLAAGKPVLHLSYVADDPFVAFWGDAPGLLVLKIEPEGVSDVMVLRLLDFLENSPSCFSVGKLEAFSIRAIANTYAGLIPGLTPSLSTSETEAKPAHH